MDYSWIEPDTLAASSAPVHATDIQMVHTQGIRAILSLTERPLSRTIPLALLQALDIACFHVPIAEMQPPSIGQAREILSILRSMAAHQRPLLVHCRAGVGRTGTVLHLYYLAQGLSLAKAQEHVRRARPQCVLLSQRQRAFLWMFAHNQTG